jgi:phenylacetate-coenzyme A ligase PaaK-like adenylate-forming protein
MEQTEGSREFARELMRRLETATEEIDPESLADLFRPAASYHPFNLALLHTLHSYLLKRTIAHARRYTRFYEQSPEYARENSVPDGDPPDLGCWPVINRQHVAEHLQAFIATDVRLRSIAHTTGTTGETISVYKSHEEVSFLTRYYLRMHQPQVEALASLPLSLSFPNFHHGAQIPLPAVGIPFFSGLTDDGLLRETVRMLETTYSIPGHDARISLLSGPEHELQFFTSYLLEQGRDPRSFGIAAINTTGSHLTAHRRKFLRDSWGAVVNDHFTMTEMIGGAMRCHRCDRFHLDPIVIGEVVDVDTGRAVNGGVGALVLTSLYPFVQMQPLIRYETGDLVRRVESDCVGTMTFEFLGKRRNAVGIRRGGRTDWLIFPAPLYDFLSPMPDINMHVWNANVRTTSDRSIGSLPLITISTTRDGERLRIDLVIELRYAPHYFGERTRELTSMIVSYLIEAPGTTLVEHLGEGDVVLNVDFVGPGVLKERNFIKV